MNSQTKSSAVAEIEASCRLPLLYLFLCAGFWLVISSVLGLIATMKFHLPEFLANCAWLTYGRVRPGFLNALTYGFALQAGLGVGLWYIARLGSTKVVRPIMILIGAKLWNLGVLVGILGILAGDATGFELLDMPGYAAVIVFLGYLVIAFWALVTFHHRRERHVYVSLWFVLAALFWFPWIYATANLLLVRYPVRGVAQAVLAWWYANNLQYIWLTLMGLAGIFYFVPTLTNRQLHSRYQAMFAFWMLTLCASWGGIPNSAPIPAWMPALSTVGTVLSLFSVLVVVMNLYATLEGKLSQLWDQPALKFFAFGFLAYIVVSLMNTATSIPSVSEVLNFTWFTTAQQYLQIYGFFGMAVIGAIYYILPRVMGMNFPSPAFVRAHFWLLAIGTILMVGPLAAGGISQGYALQNPNEPFINIVKSTLTFLRVSTLGELAIAIGNLLFFLNCVGLAHKFYKSRAVSAFEAATATLPAEGHA